MRSPGPADARPSDHTSDAGSPTADEPGASPGPARGRRTGAAPHTGPSPRLGRIRLRRGRQVDLLVATGYLLGAGYLLVHVWRAPGQRRLQWSYQDQIQFEWLLTVVPHELLQAHNPLFSHAINAPTGVNLLANASMPLLGLLFWPVTWTLGAAVSFPLVIALSLAATAAGWYWLLSRRVVASRAAAAVGGALCGFGPGIVSHANAHPNLVAQALVPLIVDQVLRLQEPGRARRGGAVVAALVSAQFFVGAEVAFDAMAALGLFVLVSAALRPTLAARRWRPFVAGLAVTAGATTALLAFPLWWQLAGPRSYRELPGSNWFSNDAAALLQFPADSLAGSRDAALHYAINAAEQNALWGWPLVLLAVILLVVLWRRPLARAAGICAVVLLWCSFGTRVVVGGHPTPVPAPWRLFAKLPLFDALPPSRLALLAMPFVAVLLAIATDRVVAAAATHRRPFRRGLLAGWAVVVGAALLPLVPTPLQVTARDTLPRFFSSGDWRAHVRPGRSLVPAPLADPDHVDPVMWQTSTRIGFTMPGGYFLGPVDAAGRGGWPIDQHPTARLLARVGYAGQSVQVSATDRAQARADLRDWHADAVVLADGQPHHDQLLTALRSLLGPGRRIDDVWLWDLRP